MQNSVPKIILFHTPCQTAICISARLEKETVREQGWEMQNFGACDPVLRSDIIGKLCTLSGYLKDQVSQGISKKGIVLHQKRSGEGAIGKVDLLYSCVLKGVHTLEISGSPRFLRAKLIF